MLNETDAVREMHAKNQFSFVINGKLKSRPQKYLHSHENIL
jgi:hypothetical protein